MRLLLSLCAVVLSTAVPAWAQFGNPAPAGGARLGDRATQRWQVGVVIRAIGGPCGGLFATIPVPTDWPEQSVKVDLEEITPHVKRATYRVTDGGIKQLLVEIPILPAGDTAKALVTFEVTKSAQLPPQDTAGYVVPKTPPLAVRKHLGPSPLIESTNTRIRALAKELVAGQETAWQQVEALYDGVRSRVKLERDKQKGAADALQDGKADKEDLTALFVACCRAHKVPARMVWIPDSCYAEFYLEDAEDKGHWFPCQVAGERAFGSQPDQRPILQKGDNLKLPERKEAYRFVPEFLTGKGNTGGRPEVEFVRRLEPAP